jgi:hypothetical protein
MAVSFLTETDLRLLAGMSHADLKKLVSTKSVREALIFRRNLQISLTSYSKLHPAIGGKLDIVHASILGICRHIEIAARDAFCLSYWRKMKAKFPGMSLTERVERKSKIKTDWEKLLKTLSY